MISMRVVWVVMKIPVRVRPADVVIPAQGDNRSAAWAGESWAENANAPSPLEGEDSGACVRRALAALGEGVRTPERAEPPLQLRLVPAFAGTSLRILSPKGRGKSAQE